MAYTYDYPRPEFTVDCLIFLQTGNDLKILLIERARNPFQGCWAFPGGFVEMNETIDNAAHRELEEETGLTSVALKQMYTFGAVNRDPRGRVISTAYYGFVDMQNSEIHASDDAKEAQWFSLNDLPELAFDHKEILNYALKNVTELVDLVNLKHV